LDDDGSTVRARIGPTVAYFGGTTGARLQYTYSSGAFEGYDSAGTRRLYWDSTFGLVLGEPTGPYLSLTDSTLTFCANSGTACTLAFNGTTGSIDATGSITVGTNGHIKGGATAYATGTGFWQGYDSGSYKLYIGNGTGSSDNYMTWSGSALSVRGALFANGGLTIQSNNGSGNSIESNLTSMRIATTNASGGLTLLSATGGLTLSTVGGSISVTANGSSGTGVTATKTVRAAGGTADCTLIYIGGLLTGGSC
jgi:hypothetical protein